MYMYTIESDREISKLKRKILKILGISFVNSYRKNK